MGFATLFIAAGVKRERVGRSQQAEDGPVKCLSLFYINTSEETNVAACAKNTIGKIYFDG